MKCVFFMLWLTNLILRDADNFNQAYIMCESDRKYWKKNYISALLFFTVLFSAQRKTFVSRNKPPITRSLVRKVRQLFRKRIHAVSRRFLYRIRSFYYRNLFFCVIFLFIFALRFIRFTNEFGVQPWLLQSRRLLLCAALAGLPSS